jgi:orotidine-5'-phosphate decarboxylase
MPTFAARLTERIAEHSSLCVGIDPSASLLKSCDLPDNAEGCYVFGKRVLEAVDFELAIVKPQSAFFERFGSAGLSAVEELTQLARSRGVLVLLDGKRGDIDTTGAAYAEGYFGSRTTLRVDAITVHPYLGVGALEPMFDLAVRSEGGVFVVVRSSNPEGRTLQTAKLANGDTVAQHLCREITVRNQKYGVNPPGPGSVPGMTWTATASGPIGAVVGATCDDAGPIVDAMPGAFILAPGVGAQGATIADVGVRMPSARRRVLPSVSRAILANGFNVSEIRTAIETLKSQARVLCTT